MRARALRPVLLVGIALFQHLIQQLPGLSQIFLVAQPLHPLQHFVHRVDSRRLRLRRLLLDLFGLYGIQFGFHFLIRHRPEAAVVHRLLQVVGRIQIRCRLVDSHRPATGRRWLQSRFGGLRRLLG